jgi:hypothetical protein
MPCSAAALAQQGLALRGRSAGGLGGDRLDDRPATVGGGASGRPGTSGSSWSSWAADNGGRPGTTPLRQSHSSAAIRISPSKAAPAVSLDEHVETFFADAPDDPALPGTLHGQELWFGGERRLPVAKALPIETQRDRTRKALAYLG